ncbi:MAG: hypothetical protein WAT68_12085 [Candidatus Nitrotoga sp.]
MDEQYFTDVPMQRKARTAGFSQKLAIGEHIRSAAKPSVNAASGSIGL